MDHTVFLNYDFQLRYLDIQSLLKNQMAITTLLTESTHPKFGSFTDSPNAGDAQSDAGEIERIW